MSDPHTVDALVLIDLQIDYFEAPELQQRCESLVSTCNRLIRRAAAAGAPVFEIRTEHAADASTWTLNMRDDGEGVVIEGTKGAQRVDGLDANGTIEIVKTRDSAFHQTALSGMLRERRVESIAVCGVSTESCVALTASDAYAHDLRVVLVADAIASSKPQHHDHTLGLLSEQYRQPVVDADQVGFNHPQ